MNLGCCTNLTDEALISLLNKLGQKLKILHLDYTNISLSKTSSLHISFSCLETLNLCGSSGMEESETEILSRNIDEAGLAMLLNKIGDNLKVVNLGFTSVTLSGIHSVTHTFPRLEAVNLTHCTKITVDGLKLFLNRYINIQYEYDYQNKRHTTFYSFQSISYYHLRYPAQKMNN